MQRRAFLKAGGVGALSLFCGGVLLPATPSMAAVQQQDFWYRDRFLEIRRADTGERRLIGFYVNGHYRPDEYRAGCWLFRDAKDQNSMVSMDIGLFNLLYGLQEWARAFTSDPLITLNSGYRTARRNATIEGAARNSLHIVGSAADITMRGVTLGQLNAMARYYRVGGVGTYSSFLHVDTGQVRYWQGR